MKKPLALIMVLVSAISFSVTACSKPEQPKEPMKDTNVRGEALFKQHCTPCHPEGRNVFNPQKTLFRKDREANNVMTAEDIIGKMRNPGPGMTQFGQRTISDADARLIAEYVLKTFQ